MTNTVTTTIDPELCIGCGDCVRVCPRETIELIDDIAVVTGDESLNCGHCMAVCPQEAITVAALDRATETYATFDADRRWLPHGEFDTVQLVRLMASRRSCRNYTEEPVAREVLEDLVKIGLTAPSATNSQRWTFTILPTRKAVMILGLAIKDFFQHISRLAERTALRKGLRLLGQPALDNFYRDHYETVQRAIREWDETGRERLFHGATAAILVGGLPGGSMPADDALLATQNIQLAAHSMGLGTCLIGFAVEAMANSRRVTRAIGIPDHEKIHAVIALGHPNESYERTVGRLPLRPRIFSG